MNYLSLCLNKLSRNLKNKIALGDPTVTEEDHAKLIRALNESCDSVVTDVEVVEKKSIKNYCKDKSKFLKIYTKFPSDVTKVRAVFEQGFRFGTIGFDNVTFESNMPYGLRFMIDTGIFGVSWIELKKGTYVIRGKSSKITQWQIEVDIHDYNDIECHPSAGEYASIAPVRILSFDIECASEKGTFPKAEKDPVIQIANICKIHGQEHPFVRNVSLSYEID